MTFLTAFALFVLPFISPAIQVQEKPIIVISVYPEKDGYYNVELTHPSNMDECEILEIVQESIKCKFKTHRL